jgi:dTDP-4-dehydrorhamnose reductase
MRALIFGSRGQLGKDLVRLLQAEGEILAMDLPELDICNGTQVKSAVERFSPTVVINAAAYTNVEGAEDHAEDAYRVNEIGAGVVAGAAADVGIPVVYYSTDFVFDGTKNAPYEVGDAVTPLSVYGKSKAAGESAVRAAAERHFIIRTAWLYGPGGNNFVEKMLRAASERPELRVVDDEVGSPTHTWDLAEATLALIAGQAYGTYHAVNAGACSRFEFAKTILQESGMGTPVYPCKSGDYPVKARRPACSVLSNERLESVTGYKMRPWREALRHYLQRRSGA